MDWGGALTDEEKARPSDVDSPRPEALIRLGCVGPKEIAEDDDVIIVIAPQNGGCYMRLCSTMWLLFPVVCYSVLLFPFLISTCSFSLPITFFSYFPPSPFFRPPSILPIPPSHLLLPIFPPLLSIGPSLFPTTLLSFSFSSPSLSPPYSDRRHAYRHLRRNGQSCEGQTAHHCQPQPRFSTVHSLVGCPLL
jgi:hypothetical protein